MTCAIRVWLWGLACSVLLTSAGIVDRSQAGEAPQIAQSSNTSTPIGDFGSWSARWFTSSDGSKACALDNQSAPSASGDRQWLSVTWSKRQGASFSWFEPSPKLSPDDVVIFAAGGRDYAGYVSDGTGYLHEQEDAAVQRALAAGQDVAIRIDMGGGSFSRGPYSFSANGFADAYSRIGQECGFGVAGILGSSGAGSSESTPTASAETTLDTFQNWTAVTWTTADKTTACSTDNTLRSKPGGAPDLYLEWLNSSDPYGFLVFDPRDVPLDAADQVAIAIDGLNFDLFVDKNRAYSYAESELSIVQAMASGRELSVAVIPSSGSPRSYRFSLSGFSDAYHRIGRQCAFDTAWLTPQVPNVVESQTPEPVELTLKADQVTSAMRTEHRVALLIGNAAYGVSDDQNTLYGPPKDVQDMAAVLQSLGFRVQAVTDVDLTAFNRAVSKFNEALSGGGVGLFYYSGHGMQINDENFLIPIGARLARETDAMTETFSVNDLLRIMESAPTRLSIIILDACRSNPFSTGQRGLQIGLAKIEVPEASEIVISYAAAPGRNSAEPVDEQGPVNGIYTAALMDALRIPGLELQSVMRHTRAAVRKRTEGEQIPWTSASVERPFYFNLP
jgi:invasion protein IalB